MTPKEIDQVDYIISRIIGDTKFSTREEQLAFVIGYLIKHILTVCERDSKEWLIFKNKLNDRK